MNGQERIKAEADFKSRTPLGAPWRRKDAVTRLGPGRNYVDWYVLSDDAE